LRKIASFRNGVIDGHAPGLTGKDLAAYIGAGMSSDHECTTADEAREKVRLGMTVLIREGSAARDMKALLPAVTADNARFFCFCTDDFQPGDLKAGSINQLVRKAIRLGLAPVTAIRMATINPARHFGLKRKGAVLPGYDADLIVIDDLEHVHAEMVIKSGKIAALDNECLVSCSGKHQHLAGRTVRIKRVAKKHLRIRAKGTRAKVIEIIPDQIETKLSILPVLANNGEVVPDTANDILKIAVIERHAASGKIGLGLVRGFGLRTGAIAGTVAHDSHNLIVVGTNDEDMLTAISEIKKMQGGLVVVSGRKVRAGIALPVAGLMSDKPLDHVVAKLAGLDAAVKELGTELPRPFGTLSFLALPVIPELKLTDRGLVDVKKFRIVDLYG
jgi:adenine deaminase